MYEAFSMYEEFSTYIKGGGVVGHAHPHLLTKPYVIYNMKTHLTLNLRTIPKMSRACMCQR